ncbi:hypothetical protein ACIRPK_07570 [Kitasatospora sp. NPDC101801]|uniref:hypothetical protein n=1 Tax=Kitasatospora sp. NPDC101801 TaxID=3364103 RepID=UPI0037FE561C
MPGASGYTVKHEGVEAQAKRLDDAADEVGRIRSAVADGSCQATDVFGGDDSGAAYTNFAAAWQAETQNLQSALHELAGRIRVSNASYRAGEHGVVTDLSTVGSGDYRPFG